VVVVWGHPSAPIGPTGNPWDQDTRSSREHGVGYPNYAQERTQMMSEIDAMMAPYEPDPVLPPGAGPGYYGQAPLSGNNQWIPENPLSPASTYGGLPGAGPSIYGGTPNQGSGGAVLDPVGVGAGPSMYGSAPVQGSASSVLDPIGIGAGPSDMYGTSPNLGDDPPTEPGAGPGYYGPRPNSGAYQDLTSGPEDMGPLANSVATDLDVYEAHTQRAKRERERIEAAVKANAERYDMSDSEITAEKEYYEAANKILQRQQLMMVLAAISGDPNMMNLANNFGAIGIERLNYSPIAQKMNKQSKDRLATMMQKLMIGPDGQPDGPQNMGELYQAMFQMGATPEEMDAIAGKFDFGKDSDQKWQNWRRGDEVRATNTGMPPYDSGGWTLTGNTTEPASTADTGTGIKGAQAAEILQIRNALRQAEKNNEANQTPESQAMVDDIREALELAEQLYGVTKDSEKSNPWMSTTMIKAQWDAMLSSGKVFGKKGIDWGSVNEKYGAPNGVLIEDAEDFAQFFKDYLKSVNNPVSVEALDEVMSDSDVAGSFDTEEEALAAIERGEFENGDKLDINGRIYPVVLN